MNNCRLHLAFSRERKKAVEQRNANVGFVPFASADKLQDRLACADIHVLTLRSDWTGMVVPSKFFGALAAARPYQQLFSRATQIQKFDRSLRSLLSL